MNIGDRVKFINEDYNWFGNEYIVTDIIEENTVDVVDGYDSDYTFIRDNLQVINKEPTKQASTGTLQRIQTFNVGDIIYFTMNHKDIEISFESGKVTVRDWAGNGDPVEYVVEDAEQLKELVGTLESLNKFKVES